MLVFPGFAGSRLSSLENIPVLPGPSCATVRERVRGVRGWAAQLGWGEDEMSMGPARGRAVGLSRGAASTEASFD